MRLSPHSSASNDEIMELLAWRIEWHQAQEEPATAQLLSEQWSALAEASRPQSEYLLGMQCLQQGNLLLSMRHFQRAVDCGDQPSAASVALGWACLMLQDLDGARRAFEQALHDPDQRRPSLAGLAELRAAESLGHRPQGDIWQAVSDRLEDRAHSAERLSPWLLQIAQELPLAIAR